MLLHEFEAKALIGTAGVPVPHSAGTASSPEAVRTAAVSLGGRCVLKAQVHTGGRGKAGGIRVAETADHAFELASAMLGSILRTHQAPDGLLVRSLLVEEPIAINGELYVGLLPDRAARRDVLVLSAAGGMGIEDVAAKRPDALARLPIDPVLGLRPYQARQAAFDVGVPRDRVPALVPVVMALWDAYRAHDATLLEVNPLAMLEDGRLVAADAKMAIDDNALWRHAAWSAHPDEGDGDAVEAEARRRGLQYVGLDGSVGVVGNGAGLVMATLDEVQRAGGRPANFLDVGGGATAPVVANAFELVLMNPAVKALLVNIFGGITRGDEVARGILAARDKLGRSIPLVIRLSGERAEEGRAILQAAGLAFAETMQEAARRAVDLAGAA